MYYALAKNQDYFAERVNRFIALTTCVYTKFAQDYEAEVKRYLKYEELGIYNKHGGDESSATAEKVCPIFDEFDCDDVSGDEEHGASINQYLHFVQISLEERF